MSRLLKIRNLIKNIPTERKELIKQCVIEMLDNPKSNPFESDALQGADPELYAPYIDFLAEYADHWRKITLDLYKMKQ